MVSTVALLASCPERARASPAARASRRAREEGILKMRKESRRTGDDLRVEAGMRARTSQRIESDHGQQGSRTRPTPTRGAERQAPETMRASLGPVTRHRALFPIAASVKGCLFGFLT
jgi:hypothetical protein